MTRSLHVVLYGRHAGQLTQTDGGSITFGYTEAYLDAADSTPLSLSMPLQPGAFSQRTTTAFLWGLLPDSADVRERWGRDLGVNAQNPFALLEQMGQDCPGAVQFTHHLDEVSRDGILDLVSQSEIGDRIRLLRNDATAWKVGGERWSLAGAQGKFALAKVGTRWFAPSGSAASTHIFKPGVEGYRDQALNEHLCMSALRALGMRVAATAFESFAGQEALVVTRFDRRSRDGSVTRVHQEDMCQALSVRPNRKYESSGGPTAVAVAGLIREYAQDPTGDLQRFIDGLIANYLLGAPDAHAKNYSFLLAGSQVRLAPLYDIASALPYDTIGEDHELDRSAMGIGGEKAFGKVTGRHWAHQARAMRAEPDQVVDRVRELAVLLPDALADASAAHPGELRDRLLPRVQALCDATAHAI